MNNNLDVTKESYIFTKNVLLQRTTTTVLIFPQALTFTEEVTLSNRKTSIATT